MSPGLRPGGKLGPRHRKTWHRPGGIQSAGSESEAASGVLSVGSISDASSSTATAAASDVGRSKQSMSAAQFRMRYAPSLLQALRLAGIPDQYIRGLGGLRTPSIVKELGKQIHSPSLRKTTAEGDVIWSNSLYDVLEGVAEFLDGVDRAEGGPKNESAFSNTGETGTENTKVAEICHI